MSCTFEISCIDFNHFLEFQVDNFSSLLNYGGRFDFFFCVHYYDHHHFYYETASTPHHITELIDSRIQAFPVLYHSLWLLRCIILYIALTRGLQYAMNCIVWKSSFLLGQGVLLLFVAVGFCSSSESGASWNDVDRYNVSAN
jgi:hypothetical protein